MNHSRVFRYGFRSVVVLAALVSGYAFADFGKIALIQYNGDVHFNDYGTNRDSLTRLADEAVQNGANILVFPEGSSYGYAGQGKYWCKPSASSESCLNVADVAESVPNGPSTFYWEAYARSHEVYVLFNIPEVDGAGFYNATVIVGPEGFVAKYRKRMLYHVDELYATPGDSPLVLSTPYGEFGILICMDATYAGLLESYVPAGVDAAILMMDWDDSPHGPYAASKWFVQRAKHANLDIYASDVSAWDGTGKYPATGSKRERTGLPEQAIGMDGISYHDLNYREAPAAL